MRTPQPGWVYVMTHPAWSKNGMVKIGKTTRNPEGRATEIASVSGLLAPCTVAWCAWVSDVHKIEPAVHAMLDRYRVRRQREMFRVDVGAATAAITRAEGVTFAPTTVVPRSRRRRAYRARRRRGVEIVLTMLLLAAAFIAAWWRP
jgi:hypothetical protein